MVQKEKKGKKLKVLSKKEYEKLLRYTKYHLRKVTGIEAEDILHEVAFNVFSKVDFETSVENLVAYLYRSVKNKIIELIRKPKRVTSLNLPVETNIFLESAKDEYENIGEETEKEELYKKLHSAIRQLPNIYQSVIIETMFEGKTIKELSHEWNIPVGTLLSRKHRALAKLRNILENSFIEK